MNEAFNKFCKDIKFEIPTYLQESKIINVENYIFEEKFLIEIEFERFPNIFDFDNFLRLVKNNFQYNYEFKFTYRKINYDNIFFHSLITYILNQKIKTLNLFYSQNVKYHENNNTLDITLFNEELIQDFEKNKEFLIEKINWFGLNILIEIIDNSKKNDILNEINLEKAFAFKEHLKWQKENPPQEEIKENNFKYKKKYNNSYFKTNIFELRESDEKKFLIEGEICSIDSIETKSGLVIFNLLISDQDEAIYAKSFLRKEEEISFYNSLNENDFIQITGTKNFDKFGEIFLSINYLEKIIKTDIKNDVANKKRIEFGIRSSMTSMDGFLTPKKFVKQAKEFGHSALAIIDKHSIQSFPEFYYESKKNNIKPIYGVSLDIINKGNEIIFNLKEGILNNETYVVFDIETTGLSPIMNEVIEFGAVIIKNGKIIDRNQFFMKPLEKISDFTKELTNISDTDLENAQSEKEGMIKIKEYIKDYTLVAHNAKFDVNFLKEKFFKYELGEIKNQWIDTLALSWYIIEKASSYTLQKVANKMAIDYNQNEAHRADYDSEVLAKIWVMFLIKLTTKKIVSFQDLFDIYSPKILTKRRGIEYSFIAKNQQGLKELFKLVSKSHTDNFFGGPKLYLNEISKLNNVLKGQIGITSALFEKIFFSTWKEIEEIILDSDFISIPRISLFVHKFKRKDVDLEKLKILLKKIIYFAKEKNKIVIADGDVRYLEESDSLFHEIYIYAKGLMGKRHYLFKYGEQDPTFPKQNFLSTNGMLKEYDFLNSKDLAFEIVVENTNKLASLIDNNIEIIKKKLFSPIFDNSDANLEKIVNDNAKKMYGQKLPDIVKNRIEQELKPIIKHGFSVVYWISHKLVKKSLLDGYLVGSRGSVGSSLVATMAGITEVNPLPPHYVCKNCTFSEFPNDDNITSGYDLKFKNCPNCNKELSREGQTIPFETFLGFEANKVPDIDLNFSGEYQSIIHQEVKKIFGNKKCFRAGTISTVAPKTAFGLTKKWMEDKNIEKSRAFVDAASKKIYGSKRTAGQHPGGIIIVPNEFEIEDFSPINYPANDTNSDWQTTHFDFHAIHDNLLKLDLLGHDDPTAIKLLEKLTGVSPTKIPFNDPKIISLFTSPKALGINPDDIMGEKTGVLGIPEFGTNFVRKMLLTAKPKSFADLVSVSGLSHGKDVWKGNAEDIIKNQKLSLKEVISCRDDIMVYLINKKIDPLLSFQIMEKVRKGQGINSDEEKELIAHSVPKWYIDSLQKIKYMFPKAHATAYVMMAWRVAWYKLYYPLEYYATFFSTRVDIFDIDIMSATKQEIINHYRSISKTIRSNENVSTKEEKLLPILEILVEMLSRGFQIKNVSLYESDAFDWKINKDEGSLIPPFIVIDGLGEEAAKSIIRERKINKFISIQNLTKRTLLNKTNLEKMKKLGILKDLDESDQRSLF